MQASIPREVQGRERHKAVESAHSGKQVHRKRKAVNSNEFVIVSEEVTGDAEVTSVYRVAGGEIHVTSRFGNAPYSSLLYKIVKGKMGDFSERALKGATPE
jgi:hypothetical protein